MVGNMRICWFVLCQCNAEVAQAAPKPKCVLERVTGEELPLKDFLPAPFRGDRYGYAKEIRNLSRQVSSQLAGGAATRKRVLLPR